MDKRKAELTASVLIFFISLVIIFNDNLVEGGVETDLGSMFLPRFLAFALIVLSIFLSVKSIKEIMRSKAPQEDEVIDLNGFSGVFYYIGILFFYWFSMPYIGFVFSTFLVMIAVANLLGGKQWMVVIVMALIVSIAIDYGAEKLLYIYLPTWTLF